jgi:mannose-6-phosphate isomerase-like protein (cupin superfamily)
MTLVRHQDRPVLTNGDFTFRPTAVPSLGTTELAVWTIDVPAGAASEPHSVSREEVFLVTAGSLTAELPDGPRAAGPGDAVVVPPMVDFRLVNTGSGPAAATVITSAGIRGRLGSVTIAPPWAQ